MQSTKTILMIKPSAFRFNEETAINNHFQFADQSQTATQIKNKAVQEFDGMVSILQKNGVEVIVVDHDNGTATPDAVFPNNWFSKHKNGDVYLYPMNAMNRRLERKLEIFDTLKKSITYEFQISLISLKGKKRICF